MKPADLDMDRDAVRMVDLVTAVRDELAALEGVLPAAMDAQWTSAPVARPREDTAERMKNRRSEPTADITLDPHRLQLRDQVVRSGHTLNRALIALRQVRQGVEQALTPWHGEDIEHG
ncbi:hypothetical protein [Micromonospora sp. WMMD980]|uniref:DUF7169 domain-containing protein n=1 Tax=Micromonospora sp. WMMD980 TaxID=3016088 RepID=UPI002416B0F4|nr:hypothetical protein [Micromonospora sp. WMMD980]MDG4801747.1 hypothetical protein [Micromonospora sp. WMMD980]